MLTELPNLYIPLAHITPGGNSAIEGFIHPFLGFDHMLAMLAVGLLSAKMGGRAIWTVPAAFVMVMAFGGILGILHIPLPAVEYAISASVIALGIGLLIKRNLSEGIAIILVAIFALFHGHAHGEEIPRLKQTVLYVAAFVIGFMSATAGLHVIGALFGTMALRTKRSAWVLRFGGLVMAALGVALIFGVISA